MVFLVKRWVWLGLLLFLTTVSADACSCYPSTLREGYEDADRVFVGKVLTVNYLDKDTAVFALEQDYPSFSYMAYTLEILLPIKGGTKKNTLIRVYTGLGGGDCGYPFTVGKQYTVFSYKRQLCLHQRAEWADYTNICTQTNDYRPVDVDSLKHWNRQHAQSKNYCDCLGKRGTQPAYSSCKNVTERPVFGNSEQDWLDYLSLNLGSLDSFELESRVWEFSYIVNATGQIVDVYLWQPDVKAHPRVLKYIQSVLTRAPLWVAGQCDGIPVPVWQKILYCPCRRN